MRTTKAMLEKEIEDLRNYTESLYNSLDKERLLRKSAEEKIDVYKRLTPDHGETTKSISMIIEAIAHVLTDLKQLKLRSS